MFICFFFSRIYRATKDQNLMGVNCVNMTRLSKRGWSSKLGAFVSSIQAVDSQHQCGSNGGDNARQMLSIDESKPDTAVWLMIVTTCDNWTSGFLCVIFKISLIMFVYFFENSNTTWWLYFHFLIFSSRWLSIVPFVGFVCSFWSGVSAMSYYFSVII